jgi:hypothetical protein
LTNTKHHYSRAKHFGSETDLAHATMAPRWMPRWILYPGTLHASFNGLTY